MTKQRIPRREFLARSSAAALALGLGAAPYAGAASGPARKWRKALKYTMLPGKLSDREKFEMARRCRFEGIDGVPTDDLDAARAQAKLAREIGVPIHGIVPDGWSHPLSHPDPAVVAKGLDGLRTALRCANAMRADTVLLVPAVVTRDVSYADAYRRSQDNVRRLLPLAAEMQVSIAIENVWNKFLLSPLEFARYIDEFESPWVRAYFDVGNVIVHGFAQHWIRTLGPRIIKLDLKDFRRSGYQWTNLLDGDVDWPDVRRALDEIKFEGWMTVELDGGGEAYLTDVAKRVDKIIAG